MDQWFRTGGLYAGLAVVIGAAVFLVRLWRPEQQVRLHTENLLRTLEQKNWAGFEAFIAPDYHDQWHNDRSTLIERTRIVFARTRGARLTSDPPTLHANKNGGHWQSRILVSGEPNDMLLAIRDRVNFLATPFDLEWRHVSRTPWDWRLVSVTNPELAIPEFIE